MNWYKIAQLYKIAFRNPIDLATNKIANKILSIVMHLYKENRLFTQDHRDASIDIKYEDFKDILKVTINLDILRASAQRPFLIEAQYSSIQPSVFLTIFSPFTESFDRRMDINIKISQNFSNKFFNDFYKEAVMVIRHELQHMIQDQERMPLLYRRDYDIQKLEEPDPVKRFNEISKYLSSRFEQEPFIRGFMLFCKKEKLSVIETIKSFIHDTLFTKNPVIERTIKDKYGLQAEHIENLLTNLYIQRAKEIFPNIKNIS